jgi:hypothetical protein
LLKQIVSARNSSSLYIFIYLSHTPRLPAMAFARFQAPSSKDLAERSPMDPRTTALWSLYEPGTDPATMSSYAYDQSLHINHKFDILNVPPARKSLTPSVSNRPLNYGDCRFLVIYPPAYPCTQRRVRRLDVSPPHSNEHCYRLSQSIR